MAFTDVLNTDMRRIVASVCRQWRGKDIYVAFSGNFTVEGILCDIGDFRSIHSQDIALYATAIGRYLAGEEFKIDVYDIPDYEWLKPWVEPGLDTIATLLLCTKALPWVGRNEAYHKRMLAAYQRHWPELHVATKQKIKPVLDKIKITSYFAGDMIDFLNGAPEEAVVIAFPPNYSGGYGKINKRFDRAFAWPRISRALPDKERIEAFLDMVMKRPNFLIARDTCTPKMEPYLVGQVQTSLSVWKRPIFIYSKHRDKTYLTCPAQKIEDVHIKRLGEDEDIASPLRLVPITQAQLNTLRSQYLSIHIAPASASVRLAVLSGDKLIGALGFDKSNWMHDSAFMLADFTISPTKYKKLSKLVLAAALSTEVREHLMESFNQNITKVFTTAYTTKGASMKYRGLFKEHSKKENAINYEAEAGKWTLEEGLAWWMKNNSETKS